MLQIVQEYAALSVSDCEVLATSGEVKRHDGTERCIRSRPVGKYREGRKVNLNFPRVNEVIRFRRGYEHTILSWAALCLLAKARI